MDSTTPDHGAIERLLAAEYGLAGRGSRLSGENENYLVVAGDRRYVLKLAAIDASPEALAVETAAVAAAEAAALGIALPHVVPTRRGTPLATCSGAGAPRHARLLGFVEGTPWGASGPIPAALRLEAGRLVARMTRALAAVDSTSARRTHRWDLTAVGRLRGRTAAIADPRGRRAVDQALFLWAGAAAPFLAALPHSLIHGDINDENLLVTDGRLCGLIDFGDCLYNPTVCDLAIALTYLVLDEDDPLAAGADIVAGYHAERRLTPSEIEVLFPLVCGRLAASLVIAADRRRIDPERSAWFVTEERAWRALGRHLPIDPVDAADRLAARIDVAPFPDRGAPVAELIERRRARLSGALSVSYREPLKLIRGRAQFLYDGRGRPYLDLYNNVCHVGHCHPRVVAAGQRQMARLNTNTRYLYDALASYAERLTATLPAALCRCFFVNSGSEANELALRLARTRTGRRDVLVLEHAYHGHTTTLVDISPYKFMGPGGEGRPRPWVHVVPVPDGYRGVHKGRGRETGTAYGDEVGRVIAAMERPPAALIAESLPSCAGQIVPPPGYFETAFQHVRAAGGVCILDEVQVGFGRVGAAFWGFELQQVVPDIVVMGKPIGNGHPMAAVVTTREIAESFAAAGMEFFSTFGGNPVSCAIGEAVLDVVRDEELQASARRVGDALLEGLRGLMDRHSLVGDVRGIGLFVGIELVKDRGTLEPAGAEAAAIVNRLRERQILTGTDGPFHNVVKIKPPLVVTEADARQAVAVVDEILTAGPG